MYDEATTRPEALLDILDENVEWDVSALDVPGVPARGRGRETVRSFFRSWVGAFEDWSYDVEELIDAGDTVVARIHQWGRGKASGVTVEARFWQLWTMRDGKAIRATHRTSRADALEAAGMSE